MNYVVLGIAMALAAVLVAASALAYGASLPSTRIVTTTVSAPSTNSSGVRVYQVTFRQVGDCTPAVYTAPWSVAMGAETEAEPANTTLPVPSSGISGSPSFVNESAIVFSVPNGVYSYTIAPKFGFSSTSGTVTVQGDDLTISLYQEFSCSSVSTPGAP